MYKFRFLVLVVMMGLTFFFLGCGQGYAQKQGSARDFTLQDSGGFEVRLSDYSGKVIVLNFFATWCPPCRVEIPEFNLFHAANPDVEVIGILLDGNGPEDARKAKDSFNISYSVLVDDGRVSNDYGPIRAIPTTVIIGKDFNIADRHVGMMNRAALEEKIKGL